MSAEDEEGAGGPAPSVIDVRGVSRRFGRTVAVEAVDLDLAPGAMLGLVGPDGAGKSTTIRLLAGILAPDGGSGRVLGYDLIRQRGHIRRRVGYLSQQFSLYGDLTVDENIEFSARIHDVRDFAPRRDELLEFTRLAAFRGRLADHLSGGMRQKLALACTLIHRPELILLDEPTTGVDPVSRREFWHILADLVGRGIAVVLATPYLDEAERCTRVALLHRGRLIRCAPPGVLSAQLPGRLLEVRADDLRRVLEALRGESGVRGAHQVGDRVHVMVPAEEGEEAVRRRLREAGIEAARIRGVTPGLEDAFIHWVGAAGGEGAA